MHDVRTATITSVLMLFILALFVVYSEATFASRDGLLTVTFLDVGQGDSILIESPTGTQVLIDGGKNGTVLSALGAELGFFDKEIDMIIATHPDADHIGGLVDVLERYEVDTILMTENINDTPVRDAFIEAVENEGATIRYARAGQEYVIGNGSAGTTTLEILFPDYDPTNLESNLSSIVARLTYGDSEYLFTGDSPKEIEEYLVAKGERLESDVLKVGHHGSRTSTAETFVSAVDPDYAIISAGKYNSYGHPHKEVVEILNAHNVVQLNTAEEGSITSISDGTKIWFK